jgi:hypothetical protein
MIALVWGALQSKLAGPIAAAVAVALACFLLAASLQIVGLKHKVADMSEKLAKARTSLKTCTENTEKLSMSIAAQNIAVEAMRADDARRAREGAEAMRRARAGAVEANRRADAIRRQVSRDACGDDLILGSVR